MPNQMVDMQEHVGKTRDDALRYCASWKSIPKQAKSCGILENFRDVITEYGKGMIGYYYYISKKYNNEKARLFESDMLYYITTNNEDYFCFNFPYSKLSLEKKYNDEKFDEIQRREDFERRYNVDMHYILNDDKFNEIMHDYRDEIDNDNSELDGSSYPDLMEDDESSSDSDEDYDSYKMFAR